METTTTAANNKKILAIEDDPEVLSLYVSFFKKQGYDVVTASGAVEAMATLEANPDTRLVLLDLNLPGMSGEEWMKWYFERPNKVPVVVASGKGDILTITRDQNMTAALTKPFHMEELQELVEVLMADDWRGEVSGDPTLH
jgi:DNA-binding response OmpR family regulator